LYWESWQANQNELRISLGGGRAVTALPFLCTASISGVEKEAITVVIASFRGRDANKRPLAKETSLSSHGATAVSNPDE